MNPRQILAVLVLLFALSANLVVGARSAGKSADAEEREAAFEKLELFAEVIEQVRRHYVDGDKTRYEELIHSALKGMLQELDPHSQFLDHDMYEDMKEDTTGKFGGLGIVIGTKDGFLTVISPMEDTPGYRAGILAGDRIVEINGESTEDLALSDAVNMLRGEPGTEVTIRIVRSGKEEIQALTIVREIINVPSVKDAKILQDGIGYVRIIQFNEPTAADLDAALKKLEEDGLRGLVLDLRDNPGGLLDSAVDVGQKFLARRKMIVFTQGRDPNDRKTYRARGGSRYLDFPMVILVNGGSASASEIVAGALQDHQRAVLVGERTFGKGSVQSILPQEDGTAIRITTAKYYTPSERVIHDHGINPDIEVPMDPVQWQKLRAHRSQPKDSPVDEEARKELDSIVDTQLERALDVIKGILIFEEKNPRPAKPEATAAKASD